MYKKLVTIFALRSEAEISGENSSLDYLDFLLEGSELKLVKWSRAGRTTLTWMANFCRLLDLYRVSSSQVGDVLVVKLPTASQLPWAVVLTWRYKKRLIFWIDGLNWSPLPLGMTVRLLLREPVLLLSRVVLNNRLWVRLVRRMDFELIVSSETQKKSLARLISSTSRIYNIPNGTNIGHATFAKEDELRMDDTSGVFNIGYIGHTYMTKGVGDLIAALSIARRHPYPFSSEFAFSSLGSRSVVMKAKACGYAVHGAVNKVDFYNRISLLVIPYWNDWGTNVYPNVLLESMECGVPVVTTDSPIARELFGSNGLAVFIPPNNPEVLARTLVGILSNEISLPTAVSLKNNFQSRFSCSILRGQWLSVLNR